MTIRPIRKVNKNYKEKTNIIFGYKMLYIRCVDCFWVDLSLIWGRVWNEFWFVLADCCSFLGGDLMCFRSSTFSGGLVSLVFILNVDIGSACVRCSFFFFYSVNS